MHMCMWVQVPPFATELFLHPKHLLSNSKSSFGEGTRSFEDCGPSSLRRLWSFEEGPRRAPLEKALAPAVRSEKSFALGLEIQGTLRRIRSFGTILEKPKDSKSIV